MLYDVETREFEIEAPKDRMSEPRDALLPATYVLPRPHRRELHTALNEFCNEVSVIRVAEIGAGLGT